MSELTKGKWETGQRSATCFEKEIAKLKKQRDLLLKACKTIQAARDACRSGKMDVKDVNKVELDKLIDTAIAKAKKE